MKPVGIARAKDTTGREDESLGAVALGALKGEALANALMKAETKAKRRVTLSLAGLGWLDETEVATIPGAQAGEPTEAHETDAPAPVRPPGDSNGQDPSAGDRISCDQARELKQLAQAAFGFAAGERQLREDLGLAVDKPLTLMHLQAHISPARYAALLTDYQAALRQEIEADVPDPTPPAPATSAPVRAMTVQPSGGSHNGEPSADVATGVTPPHGQSEPTPAERQRWGQLSRRSLRVRLHPSVWKSLRSGPYAAAERVILALETSPATGDA